MDNPKTVWQHHLDQLRKIYTDSTTIETEGISSSDALPELSDSMIDVDLISNDATNQSPNLVNEKLNTSTLVQYPHQFQRPLFQFLTGIHPGPESLLIASDSRREDRRCNDLNLRK